MSGQMTLFKVEKKVDEKVTSKVTKKVKTEEVSDVIEMTISEKDKHGWSQLPSNDEKKNIGMDYAYIQLFSQSDLNGIRYRASFSENHENPHNMLGSSYGGGGGFNPSNLDEIQQVFDGLMERKKHHLTEPYRTFTDAEQKVCFEHHLLYYDFRLIPAKNYFVVVADELVALFKKAGFDFEAWYKEYKALPELMATENDWKRGLEKLIWLEKGEKTNDKLEALEPILLLKGIDELKATKKEVKDLFEKKLLELKEINDTLEKLGEHDEYGFDIKRYQDTLMKCWW
jgi:hypothetical protein